MFLKSNLIVSCVSGLAMVLLTAGCGARQNNSHMHKIGTNAADTDLFGAHWAAGQVGAPANPQNQMHPNTLAPVVGCGAYDSAGCCTTSARYVAGGCARMRGSVGVPHQFDINPNTNKGLVNNSGVGFAAGPYVGTAIPDPSRGVAGRVNAAAGVKQTQINNRDLSILDRLPQ